MTAPPHKKITTTITPFSASEAGYPIFDLVRVPKDSQMIGLAPARWLPPNAADARRVIEIRWMVPAAPSDTMYDDYTLVVTPPGVDVPDGVAASHFLGNVGHFLLFVIKNASWFGAADHSDTSQSPIDRAIDHATAFPVKSSESSRTQCKTPNQSNTPNRTACDAQAVAECVHHLEQTGTMIQRAVAELGRTNLPQIKVVLSEPARVRLAEVSHGLYAELERTMRRLSVKRLRDQTLETQQQSKSETVIESAKSAVCLAAKGDALREAVEEIARRLAATLHKHNQIVRKDPRGTEPLPLHEVASRVGISEASAVFVMCGHRTPNGQSTFCDVYTSSPDITNHAVDYFALEEQDTATGESET